VGQALGGGHQGLMAEVHAVEVPDGDRGRTQRTP